MPTDTAICVLSGGYVIVTESSNGHLGHDEDKACGVSKGVSVEFGFCAVTPNSVQNLKPLFSARCL